MESRRQLLITCDDLGYHPTINEAITEILARGIVRSASIMAPAPHFDDAVARLRAIGHTDVGVHLTLTSEYWDLPVVPLSPHTQVASLIEEDGRFPRDVPARPLEPVEVARELRAQIERVRRTGLRLTHLDGHMFCYEPALAGTRIFDAVHALAREYGLPLRCRAGATGGPAVRMLWTEVRDVDGRHAYYRDFLRGLTSARTELIIHPGKDLAVMQAFSTSAACRFADYTFFRSEAFERLTIEERIAIVGPTEL